jgi:hypothetical protein
MDGQADPRVNGTKDGENAAHAFDPSGLEVDMVTHRILELPMNDSTRPWPGFAPLTEIVAGKRSNNTRLKQIQRALKAKGMTTQEISDDEFFELIGNMVPRSSPSSISIRQDLVPIMLSYFNHPVGKDMIRLYCLPSFRQATAITAERFKACRTVFYVLAAKFNVATKVLHWDLREDKLALSVYGDVNSEKQVHLVADSNNFYWIKPGNKPKREMHTISVNVVAPTTRTFSGRQYTIPWDGYQNGTRQRLICDDGVEYELRCELIGGEFHITKYLPGSGHSIHDESFPTSIPVTFNTVPRKIKVHEIPASQSEASQGLSSPTRPTSTNVPVDVFRSGIDNLIDLLEGLPAVGEGWKNARASTRQRVANLGQNYMESIHAYDENPIRVLIMGELGKGKSTLLSQILRNNLISEEEWKQRSPHQPRKGMDPADEPMDVVTPELDEDLVDAEKEVELMNNDSYNPKGLDIFPTSGARETTTRQLQTAKCSYKTVGFEIVRMPHVQRINKVSALRSFIREVMLNADWRSDQDEVSKQLVAGDFIQAMGLVGLDAETLCDIVNEEDFDINTLRMPMEIWNAPERQVTMWYYSEDKSLKDSIEELVASYRNALTEPDEYHGLVLSSTIYLPMKKNLEITDPPGLNSLDIYSHERAVNALREPFDILLLLVGKGIPNSELDAVLKASRLGELFRNHREQPISVVTLFSLGKEEVKDAKDKRKALDVLKKEQKTKKQKWLKSVIKPPREGEEWFQKVCPLFYVDALGEIHLPDETMSVSQLLDYFQETKKLFGNIRRQPFFRQLIDHWSNVWDEARIFHSLTQEEVRKGVAGGITQIGRNREFFRNLSDSVMSLLQGGSASVGRGSSNNPLAVLDEALTKAASKCAAREIEDLLDNERKEYFNRYAKPSAKMLGKDLVRPARTPNGVYNQLTLLCFSPLIEAVVELASTPVALTGSNHKRAAEEVVTRVQSLLSPRQQDNEPLQFVLDVEKQRFQRTIKNVLLNFEESERRNFAKQLDGSFYDSLEEYLDQDLFPRAKAAKPRPNIRLKPNEAKIKVLKDEVTTYANSIADSIKKHVKLDASEARNNISVKLLEAVREVRERLQNYAPEQLPLAANMDVPHAQKIAKEMINLVEGLENVIGTNDLSADFKSSIDTAREFLNNQSQHPGLQVPQSSRSQAPSRKRSPSPSAPRKQRK